MAAKILDLFSFTRFVARRFLRDRGPQVAASLTYTTLLSLAPFVTIALALLSAFPIFSDLSEQIRKFLLTNMVPQAAGKMITLYGEFSANAANLTAFGIAFLAVAAFLMMLTIERAFNDIWGVTRARPLLHRLLVYWAVLTLGPVLLGVSLSLSSYVVTRSLGYVQRVPGADWALLRLTPVVISAFAFFLLYLTVPNRYVPRRHALAGGVIAALLFEMMKRAFTSYIAWFPNYKLIYGAFASVPIFLLWVYLSWTVVILGAEIAAALSHWRGGAWRVQTSPQQRFYDALRVLRLLYQAQQVGVPVSLDALRKALPLGLDHLEALLQRMTRGALALRTGNRGYVLARSPEQIKLADVYRLFVLEGESAVVPAAVAGDKLASVLDAITRDVEATMQRSLDSIFPQTFREPSRAADQQDAPPAAHQSDHATAETRQPGERDSPSTTAPAATHVRLHQ